MLDQEIAWHDDEKGAGLGTLLATQPNMVREAAIAATANILMGFSTTITGLVIAFMADWKLTALLLTVFPFLVVANVVNFRSIKGFSNSFAVIVPVPPTFFLSFACRSYDCCKQGV